MSDPATVEESLANPDAFAGKMVKQVTEHYAEAIALLDQSPVPPSTRRSSRV